MGRSLIRTRAPQGGPPARPVAALRLAFCLALCPAPVLTLLFALFLSACIEKPDPASQAAAILHKHPSTFLDKLTALDALAGRELLAAADPAAPTPPPPALAESLYAFSVRLRPALQTAPSNSDRVRLLTAFVFDSLGLVPRLDDTSLETSLPSHVLVLKQGSCLGLTLLFLALGQGLDLPLAPVFLPGHVFVRYGSGPEARNIETLRRGIARTDSFYRATFSLTQRPWYSLAAAEPDQALGALVFNLGNFHRGRENWAAAMEEYRLAEESLPGFPEALGNRGAGFLVAGDAKSAKEKLEAALAGDSLAVPAWRNLEAIYRAEGDSAKAQWARNRLHP